MITKQNKAKKTRTKLIRNEYNYAANEASHCLIKKTKKTIKLSKH